MDQKKPTPKYTAEFRERGVRLFREQRPDYTSDNAAYRAIASKRGCSHDTLRAWCIQASAAAYLGLTPRRYESGEISRNGRISKRGDMFTRKCLFEAANAIFCRNLDGSRLRTWAKAIAERTGPRKAKVALARRLAVTLHAMWRTGTPFREAMA